MTLEFGLRMRRHIDGSTFIAPMGSEQAARDRVAAWSRSSTSGWSAEPVAVVARDVGAWVDVESGQ